MNGSNIVSVCSGIGLTIRELFTAVAIVFDRAIQCKTFLITWTDISAVVAFGLFELNSLAVFDRALTEYRSRPS